MSEGRQKKKRLRQKTCVFFLQKSTQNLAGRVMLNTDKRLNGLTVHFRGKSRWVIEIVRYSHRRALSDRR